MTRIREPKFHILALVATVVLLGAACGSTATVDTGTPTPTDGSGQTAGAPDPDSADPLERLAAARDLWSESGPTTYAMTTQLQCFCPQIEWKNVVVDGEITSTVSTGEDPFIEPEAQTMEDLFDEVEAAARAEYARLDLEFDSTTGALLNYWVDVDEMIADEEHGVIVTVSTIDEVAPETTIPPVVSTTLDAAAVAGLIDDYGCGFGFAKGNATQTLGLIIYHQGGYTEAGPDLSSAIEFPNDQWVAEVQVGSDLFANWCDDVMEEGEPVPAVASVWRVVSGTMIATAADSPHVVVGSLTDVVIESPSGEQIEVAEIALANDGYGFFAG